jgi:hypothetical protein
MVVSKGDDNLLSFTRCDGWHFPQHADGNYAGAHPADDAQAIEHLERLRARGGEYLLFPQTAFWWLDHYTQLRSHLESRYRRVFNNPDCIIYELADHKSGLRARLRQQILKRARRVS